MNLAARRQIATALLTAKDTQLVTELHISALAQTFEYLQTANLLPHFGESDLDSSTKQAAQNVVTLQTNLQKTLANVVHLHALNLMFSKLTCLRLLNQANLDKSFEHAEFGGFLGIAAHNLTAAHLLNQTSLDALFSDPQAACKTSLAICRAATDKETQANVERNTQEITPYFYGRLYQPVASKPLVRTIPRPPQIIIPRR